MKSFYISIIALLFSCVAIAQQDTIPNAGFEVWNFNPQYDDPANWTTLNPLAAIFSAQLAFKAEAAGEFHSGAAAIKLVTTNLPGVGIAPSILTNGMVNTATQNIEGGKPFNSRPVSFGGWFRLDPMGDDTAFANILLTRWNAVNSTREVVGSTDAQITNTSGEFVNLELTIAYNTTDMPDTVLMLMGSGADTPQQGTALFVDDLYYTYPAGIESPESVGLSLYPNPVVDVLNITNTNGISFRTGSIFSMEGKLVRNLTLSGRSIDLQDLAPSAYILELMDAQGTTVRQQFIKK